jgi:hypothetical protein
MRPLAFVLGALAGSAAMPARARRLRSGTHAALDPIAFSVPAVAAGTCALGALAIGALAIGALAIGRLEIRKARLREVEIDSLTVRHLKVIEETAGEPNRADS